MSHWATKNNMKGLTNFISDVRECRGKEAEEKRVNKELANMRKKFTDKQGIKGYDRKKYVCKMLYVYLLGYDVDFGYMEAIQLLSAEKFSEKQVGYIALEILLNEEHEMLPLLVQALCDDLEARSEYSQCLALTAIANLGGKAMAEAQIAQGVVKLILSNGTTPMVKKKAILAFLQLFRKYPGLITADPWATRFISLLSSQDLGIICALMSLLLSVVEQETEGYDICVPTVIEVLCKVLAGDFSRDYTYYNIPHPWLQVKLLRFLRRFPPTTDKTSANSLRDALSRILSAAEKSLATDQASINHKNALNCVLFEALSLISHLDNDPSLLKHSAELLGRFVSAKEPNSRYLGLDAMTHLASLGDRKIAAIIKRQMDTVLSSLNDADISIRRRALDLLYSMCDKSNSKKIVAEMLEFLIRADFDIREELVIKIAILAEKYASSNAWFVDTVLRLISLGGESVPDDIWYRVVQVVTNHEDVQQYSCKNVLKALQQPNCHETMVKVGGYLLGEFGHLIEDQPGCSALEQFTALHSKFYSSSLPTRAILLSAYAKFLNVYPEYLAETIEELFRQHSTFVDAEIQQRSCEFYNLSKLDKPELMQTVLDVMPAFSQTQDPVTGPHSDSEGEEDEPSPSHEEDSSSALPYDVSSSSSSINPYAAADQARAAPYSPHPLPQQPPYQPSPASPSPPGSFSPSPPGSFSGGPSLGAYGSASGGAPDVLAAAAPSQPEDLLGEMFKFLVVNKEGLLYEGPNLQIGLKSEYKNEQGRVMLFYGNTNPQSPLTQFTVIVPPVNYLSIQLQPISSTIAPGQQEQQLINLSCLGEFHDALPFRISYLLNGKTENVSLKLPVVLTKFIVPNVLSKNDFFGTWKQYSGPPYEHQSIFRASKIIDLSSITANLSTGFNLAVLEGVDQNPSNLVASGLLHVSAAASGGGVKTIPVLLRLETNQEAKMLRLTIRSSDGTVTPAIKALLAAHLIC
ncbi:AP-2 complex subunit alpha [Balamuthia mandrillaris]